MKGGSLYISLDREPTLTRGNIQGTPFHLLQKGEILKRYTCENKTLRVKVQHHHEKWEFLVSKGIVFGLSTFLQSPTPHERACSQAKVFEVSVFLTLRQFIFCLDHHSFNSISLGKLNSIFPLLQPCLCL